MLERPTQKTPEQNQVEDKFAKKKRLFINGAWVETVDIKPEKPKLRTPVFIGPGWGATMESFKPGMETMIENGREVVSLDQPREGGEAPDIQNKEIATWFKEIGRPYPKFPTEMRRRGSTLQAFIKEKRIPKLDAVVHSMGALDVVYAAMHDPEPFIGRTIVLSNPAGLIGKDSILRLQKGAAENTTRTGTMSRKDFPVTRAERDYLASTEHITPDYIRGNRIRGLVKETWTMSQAQIEDMLRYLHFKGVKIVVVGAVDDTIFPMDKMQKNTKWNFIDGFLSVRGGHMQLQTHPELFMAAAESMLSQND